MTNQALETAKKWAKETYFDEKDRQEIQDLIDNNNEKEINERFYKSLAFGTGGLRSIVGMGSNRISKYNVRRATQALINAVKKADLNQKKACVSYDPRHFSLEFAKEVSSVFAANGLKCFLFSELTPTPMLSYAVRYFKADCGVMITASHNPKIYNGFKAYWNDGSQVTPPHDSIIIDEYNSLTDWSQIQHGNFDDFVSESMIEYIKEDCERSYFEIIKNSIFQKDLVAKSGHKLKALYTPLHGTGYVPCKKISKEIGFTNLDILEEQAMPDPDFSTVASPNPEDSVAMEMATKRMIEQNYDACYGTDPDCDRLGVVINHNNKPVALNGNQISIIMIDYILKFHPNINKNSYIVKSIVTSPMQNEMARKNNVTIHETLTGFKWMGALMTKLDEDPKNEFIFASEESFGYMPVNCVRDKDGISSMTLMNEIILYHKTQSRTLKDALDMIYEEYGYFLESLLSKFYHGQQGSQKINQIMEYFRNYQEESFSGIKILKRLDYKSQIQTDVASGDTSKITGYASNVIGLHMENDIRLFIRPSGTEPKIKFYTMVNSKNGSLEEKENHAKNLISKFEDKISEICEKA